MNDKTIFRKNPDIITRKIGSKLILVPLYKTSSEINCIYTLNPAAEKVWERIDGKRSWETIKKDLTGEFLDTYATSSSNIEKEFCEFLKDLQGIKAIKS